MSILRHGTDIRDPAAVTVRRLPPALAAARALMSALVFGSGLFYLVVAVQGVGWLLSPPSDLVTTAPNGAPPAPVQPFQGSEQHLEVLLRPLAITGAALAGLLLLWSGGRGLRSRQDRRLWRTLQYTGLTGLFVGVLSYAVGLSSSGTSAALYTGGSWGGVEPVWPSAALAVLVVTIGLLGPSTMPGRTLRARRSPDRPAHRRHDGPAHRRSAQGDPS